MSDDKFALLSEVAAVINSTLDLRHVLERAMDSVIHVTGAERGFLVLLDQKSGELKFRVAHHLDREAIQDPDRHVSWSVVQRVAKQGEPLLTIDAQSDAQLSQHTSVSDLGLRSVLCVPLRCKEETLGVIYVDNKSLAGRFDQDDLDLLMAVANQTAIAIENARLFQQSDAIDELVHELRTPLASSVMNAQMLQDLTTEPTLKRMATSIESELDRLLRMIGEFLDLSRLESGRQRLEKVSFDVYDLIKDSMTVVAPEAEARRITLKTQVDLGNAPPYLGDYEKLRRALINLLGNAIKYNHEGGEVIVEVAALPTLVRVAVRDNGPGIPPEYLPSLFKRFFRVPDTEGETQGAGLGLAITKRIVEEHGGEIGVTSEVGAGTTVAFTLPY